uniref:Uncharacterized protein n=1 Tax=Oryza rufipogon TaxID=4529 RepID=A0A0E0QFJ1_ORYRU
MAGLIVLRRERLERRRRRRLGDDSDDSPGLPAPSPVSSLLSLLPGLLTSFLSARPTRAPLGPPPPRPHAVVLKMLPAGATTARLSTMDAGAHLSPIPSTSPRAAVRAERWPAPARRCPSHPLAGARLSAMACRRARCCLLLADEEREREMEEERKSFEKVLTYIPIQVDLNSGSKRSEVGGGMRQRA